MIKLFQDYFSGMWSGMKQLFVERLGWQGLLVCVVVALYLGVLLPSCVHK